MNTETAKQRRVRIWGNPVGEARRFGKLGKHSTWFYRGYTILSRKEPGWNSGTSWTATKYGEYGFSADSKHVVMVKIDRHLAQVQADWEDAI